MNRFIKKAIATISLTAMLSAGFAMQAFAATQVEVTGEPVMIRSDAGLDSTAVGKAYKGDKFDYVGQKKDSTGKVWYSVKYYGNKTGWITSQFAKKKEASATNPVNAYEGIYQYGRASLTVKSTGKDSADITVEWASSASENTVWTFSGSFDPTTYRINYNKGIKRNYTYDSKGNVSSRKVVYKDGSVRVQFNSKTELVWRDENEQEKGEMTFTKVSELSSTAKQVQITATPVNVRAGAGTNYKKIGQTTKGKKYAYLASKKDSSGRVWYQIQYTSKTKGWVMGSMAKLVSASDDDYSGEYVESLAERATITVTKKKSGYDIWVRWPNGADEVYNWKFSGTFNASGVMKYTKCTKTIVTLDEKGNASTKKSYTNGTGSLTIKNGTITWKDNKDDAGKGVKFVKA